MGYSQNHTPCLGISHSKAANIWEVLKRDLNLGNYPYADDMMRER